MIVRSVHRRSINNILRRAKHFNRDKHVIQFDCRVNATTTENHRTQPVGGLPRTDDLPVVRSITRFTNAGRRGGGEISKIKCKHYAKR